MARLYKASSLRDIPTATAAYVAGIVDSEGCICLNNGLRASWGWRLQVTQLKEAGLLEWLKDETGVGAVYDKPMGKRPMQMWVVSPQADVLGLLRSVRPWLFVKADAADVAIEHIARKMEMYG